MNYSKIFVTGGCGFIGKNTVLALRNKYNCKIIVLDNVISNKINNVDYYEIDITNYNNLLDFFKEHCKTDNQSILIYHFAALSNTTQCILNPILCNNVNITGTLNIFEIGKIINAKKIICCSSHVVLDGNHPLKVTKITVENYCNLYNSLYKQSITCLRYAAIYGKNQIGGNVLNAFRNSIKKNNYITIFGDGKQERDFLHISDCIDANLKAAQSNFKGILDICTGKMTSLNYIAKNLFKSQIKYKEKRQGDAQTFNQNPLPATEKINFKYKINIEDGIKDYL